MWPRIAAAVTRFWSNQRGVTLPELITAIGVLGIVAGFVGATMFQSTGIQEEILSDGVATNELRNALSVFAVDVKKTQSSDLPTDSTPVTSVVLSWTDEYQDVVTPHSATYAVSAGKLVRTYDGADTVVARGVTSVNFSLTGSTITITLEVDSNGGTTSLSLATVMNAVGT